MDTKKLQTTPHNVIMYSIPDDGQAEVGLSPGKTLLEKSLLDNKHYINIIFSDHIMTNQSV